MEFLTTVLKHPFFWGAMLGLFLCAVSVWSHIKTKTELKRLKGHLSDKMELEADKLSSMKGEIESLKKENENMRVKVQTGKIEDSAQALERELEIFARAEKAMVLNAPGFAQAWENAKEKSENEIREEEAGKSPVKRMFRKFFKGNGSDEQKSIDSSSSGEERAALMTSDEDN